MSALKQLIPFVRLCQLFGLIPFKIAMDPETKEFLRFGFSFRSFPAVWYFTLLAVQMIAAMLPASALSGMIDNDLFRELNLSSAAIALFGAYQFTFMLLFVIKRVTVLRYKHLSRAVALVKEVEQHLNDLPQCKNRVLRRTVIGFLISATMVGLLVSIVFPLVEIFLAAFLGSSSGLSSNILFALIIIQCYLMIMVSCSFLMMHLSYYIIAHYMRLLKITLTNNVPFKSMDKDDDNMSRMKKSQFIFNNLCLATIELNQIFSFPALFMITSKLISILYGLFTFINGLIHPNVLTEKAFFMGPISFLIDSTMIYVYLNSADALVHQVGKLREKVISISNARMQSDIDYKIEIMSFMVMIDENRIRLTGSRLFKVGVHIIPPFVASLVTYLIIMIQTQINSSSTNS